MQQESQVKSPPEAPPTLRTRVINGHEFPGPHWPVHSIERSLPTPALERKISVLTELQIRRELGLADATVLDPKQQILNYLEAVKKVAPAVDQLASELQRQMPAWTVPPELVVMIPMAAFGNQEAKPITHTVELLSKDASVKAGKVAAIVFANRPEGREADMTARLIKEASQFYQAPVAVVEGEVARTLGRTDGPYFANGISPNSAPMGLIRDLIALVAIKQWQQLDQVKPPILMQMDCDFEGFERGSFATIVDRFARNPDLAFLQCGSDWQDRAVPTRSIPAMWLGSELMRELPMILKNCLNRADLPKAIREEILFSEAIQRGIQVPQAERMETRARKGGYGLLRIPCDELDLNIRSVPELEQVGVAEDVVINWNSRRALAAWRTERQPPISQWAVRFTATDWVRSADFSILDNPVQDFTAIVADSLLAANRTLARFPIPESLPGVYSCHCEAIFEVLKRYGITPNNTVVTSQPRADGSATINIEKLVDPSALLLSLGVLQ